MGGYLRYADSDVIPFADQLLPSHSREVTAGDDQPEIGVLGTTLKPREFYNPFQRFFLTQNHITTGQHPMDDL